MRRLYAHSATFRTHKSSRGFRAWLPQEPRPSSEKERRPLPEPNDRFCTPVVVLLRKRLSHWQDNCNGRIRHRSCNETSPPGASSCPDKGLLGTPCKGAARSEASSAPTHRQLFEYSWRGSITGHPAEKQAKGRRYLALPRETQSPGLRFRCVTAGTLLIFLPFVEVARSTPHTHADVVRQPSGE